MLMIARAILVWIGFMSIAGCAIRPQAAMGRFEFIEPHMGVQVRIVMYAEDSTGAGAAARVAFSEISRLESIMSDFRPDSELMLLCAQNGRRPVPISNDLYAILKRSVEISALTDGAFDVTVGPVTTLWRQAVRTGARPPPDEIAAAHRLVNWRNIVLDPERQTALLLQPNMRIDLGGIGQGYAADRALSALRAQGITACLVDVSGDIAIADPPPGTDGWVVAIADDGNTPTTTVRLHNTAISTSGDAAQHLRLDGERHSHIVDPRRSDDFGLTSSRSVTVIAPDCTTADALATALSVLEPRRGMALIEPLPHTAAKIVDGAASSGQVWRSRGFPMPRAGVLEP